LGGVTARKPGKFSSSFSNGPGLPLPWPKMTEKVTKAYMLADPKQTPLTVAQNGTDVTVSLPASAPDPIASVMVLETK
jgi:alpha-L-fucosidase